MERQTSLKGVSLRGYLLEVSARKRTETQRKGEVRTLGVGLDFEP